MTMDEEDMPDANQDKPAEAKVAKEGRPRPKRKPKPSFDEFFQNLSETITKESKKDELPSVMRLLKQGFAEEVQPDHAEKVFGLIKEYRSVDRLAVQLATALPPRPSGIARAVRNRLRSCSAELICYPADRPGEDRFFDLASWIKAGNAKPDQLDAPRHPPEWVRMAFTCLATEPDALVRSEAVHRLLTMIARTGKRGQVGSFHTDSQSFLIEVGKLVSAKKISPGKVTSALQFAHPLEEKSQQDQAALSEMRKETDEANEKSCSLIEKNVQLQQQLDSTLICEKELQQQLADTTEQLTLEKDRLNEREKHWEKRSVQDLTRQRHRIVSELGHDLQEARLALDRESPNTEMALNRIRRAEETIRKVAPTK